MRKLDPVRHEEKRREILAAARRCFERSGLKGASIADVCKEAGISPGHLYHYFASKDAIVATLAEDWLNRTRQRFERLSALESDVVAPLVAEIGALAPSGPGSGSELVFEMLAESARNPAMAKAMQAHGRSLRSILANVLRGGQERGAVDPDVDVEAAATVMIMMVDGLKALSLRDPTLDRQAAVGFMRQMLEGVLGRRRSATSSGEAPSAPPPTP
ncbi:TetR/AcrR family transcriptional regulator [Methylosinus sp. Sm6]|uniref:TetR/AcrR family transcriptional regulator n=1 Tax=Methylosinus sp. Sm6 TaxID=2866948 RepID=UPI001C999BC9|nr:TetR/AcrR family transcriptional regulator [Methylosinus sp. Sm6]MBY6239861.1 TetR/AcrR family transcriptional regulator [Methylosinus sp. Sm6]